jgi:ATP-binding cassette, subfamily B, bacterial IrtB/YbtQ
MFTQLVRVVGARQLRPMRSHLVAVVGYAVLQGAAFALLVPVLRALLGGDMTTAVRWLAVFAAVAVAACLLYCVQAMRGFTTAVSSTEALYRRFGNHLGALGVGWFSSTKIGKLTRLATTGIGEITTVFAHLLAPMVTAVVTPLTVLVVMVFLDWRLALAMAVTVPVLYVSYRWTTTVIGRADEQVDAAIADANERIVEFAQAQPVLRAFGRTQNENSWLDEAITQQHAAARRQLRGTSVARGGFGIAVQLAVTVVLVVAAMLALTGTVDAAQLIALAVLVVRFSEPVVALGDAGGALRVVRNRLDQMDLILKTPPLPVPADPQRPVGSDIELRGVRFEYPGSTTREPVLDGLDATIPENRMTALVGPSGSGKTTVTRLIARFWDVDAGSVSIGGVDVRQMSAAGLADQVAMVFQNVYLFEGSIAHNVRIGRPDATDGDVAWAARLARVDEIVERLPDGWHTAVGEGGTALSGGERQRISLARAILKRAPILVLDEATAALDPINEIAISDTLRTLTGRCTLLVIAHRLPTVMAADQILVLDQGKVVESGTHTELVGAGGLYRRFWHERDRIRGWRLSSSR